MIYQNWLYRKQWVTHCYLSDNTHINHVSSDSKANQNLKAT